MNIKDEIASLVVFYWVENFKSYNKYFQLFTKYISLMPKKIPVDKLSLQINSI